MHRLAKLYGRLPSELLALGIDDWNFNLRVAQLGVEQEEKDAARARKQR